MVKTSEHLEPYRRRDFSEGPPKTPNEPSGFAGTLYGMFVIPTIKNNRGCWHFQIRSSPGEDELAVGWEHVSVLMRKPVSKTKVVDRTPSWEEMCIVRELFWGPDECVVQFHPKHSDYVNIHKHVLHLWKATGVEFPTPPTICV